MKKMLFVALLIPIFGMSQITQKDDWGEETGIRFINERSWKAVLARAKAENKYIFVDCYATWCGPCKVMSAQVFPQKKVGDFFNTHFINVAIQFDKTAKDDQDVRAWYSDAEKLKNTFRIDGYPTYMFFTPDGKAVHRVIGAIVEPEEFIAVGKSAFNPTDQYFTVLEHYKGHLDDSAYLLNALSVVIKASDNENIPIIANKYHAALKDPFSKENIHYFVYNELIWNCKDDLFTFYVQNARVIDSIMKRRDYTSNALRSPIFNERIRPLLSASGGKVRWKEISAALRASYPGIAGALVEIEGQTMGSYIEQQIKKNSLKDPVVDWLRIHEELMKKYPDYDFNSNFMSAKLSYYERRENWDTCSHIGWELLYNYRSRIGDFAANNVIWNDIFLHSNDRQKLMDALQWIKESVQRHPDDSYYLDTYANLLYKLGHLREAIEIEEKAIDRSKVQSPGHQRAVGENLKKMKDNTPTWEDTSPVVKLG